MNRATVPAFHWWLFLYFLQFSSTFLMAFGGQFPRQKERQKNLSKPRKILEDGNQRNGELFVGMLPKLGGNDNGLLMGWSGWSEWSHCSAKCGQQGIQFQLRRCLDMYCSGAYSRHRICQAELKNCPYSVANFSSPPIPVNPLALECALRSTAENPLLSPNKLPQNCSQLECLSISAKNNSSSATTTNQSNATHFTFPTRLRDGQPCQLAIDSTQLAVCLHGRCLPVGCDRLAGSRSRPDQCGICGGDGQSCARQLFRWRDTGHFSPCDKSCGPGSKQKQNRDSKNST